MSLETDRKAVSPSRAALDGHAQGRKRYDANRLARWLLASPLLAFLVLLVLFPGVYGVLVSFRDVSVLSPQASFVGLENYRSVLGDAGFRSSLWFTLRFTVVVTSIEVLLGLGLALLFDREFPAKRLLLGLTLVPIMVAPSLMGVMFRLVLDENIGMVPYLLSFLGFKVNLFAPGSVVPLLILLDTIQWVPFTFLILYAGLQGIPRDLYEAAMVDGAGYWRRVRSVALPLLAPILFVAAFLRGIDAFRTFDVIYVLTGGGPGNASTTASIYIYKRAFQDGSIGVAAAASVLVAVLLLPVLPIVVRRLTRGGASG